MDKYVADIFLNVKDEFNENDVYQWIDIVFDEVGPSAFFVDEIRKNGFKEINFEEGYSIEIISKSHSLEDFKNKVKSLLNEILINDVSDPCDLIIYENYRNLKDMGWY